MAFDQQEYQKRIKLDNPSFRDGPSSLSALNKLIAANASAAQIKATLQDLPPAKIERYENSLRYLIDFYPGLIPSSEFLIEDHKVMKDGQPVSFQISVGPDHQTHGDLLYGISSSRGLDTYKMGSAGKLAICDNYNNAAEIGTGLAFGRTWQGVGVLDTTPDDVTRIVNSRVTSPEQPCRANEIQPGRFASYARGLLNSRYNPADTLTLPNSRVQKDTQRSPEELKKVLGQVKKKQLMQHHMAHAHFFKAVRRACKGGIAMAATSPEFAATGAKVHFVLDGLGDLASIARKEKFKNCTPITSSELAFCFRYWDTLHGIIHFYVNGEEVKAPWEANWIADDASGNPVKSSKEAWLRYGLYRQLTGRDKKPFPSAWASQSAQA